MADDLGTMLSFINQGVQPQQMSLPQIGGGETQAPQINMPQAQHSGSGVLSGILGNLASSYLSNKLNKYQEKQDAKEVGSTIDEGISAHADSLAKDSPIRSALNNIKKIPNSPYGIKIKQNAYNKFNDALASNERLTEAQKNIRDTEVGPIYRKSKAREGMPTGWEPGNAPGIMRGMMTESGLPYDQLIQHNMMERKQTAGYGQPEQLQNKEEDQALARQQAAALEHDRETRRQMMLKTQQLAQQNKLPNIPVKHATEYVSNNAAINQIDDAIKTIENNKDHFGPSKILGSLAGQYIDPKGVEARAKVSQIGGTQFHNLAGATGTLGEQKLYGPFIPNVQMDTPDAMVDKLKVLKSHMTGMNSEYEKAYKSGYKTGLPGIDNNSNNSLDVKSEEPRYEYRINPETGKQQRRRIN